MEHIINVTHELEARNVRYYSIENLMSSHMFDDFIKVENVSIEKWVSRRMLRVEGIVRLYGYKVEELTLTSPLDKLCKKALYLSSSCS